MDAEQVKGLVQGISREKKLEAWGQKIEKRLSPKGDKSNDAIKRLKVQ